MGQESVDGGGGVGEDSKKFIPGGNEKASLFLKVGKHLDILAIVYSVDH